MNPTLPAGRWSRRALAFGAGFAICFSMPPWGWWPLAFVGIALWVLLLAGQPRRRRGWVGLMVGLGWFLPSTMWMVMFSAIGWPLGVALWFPAIMAVASMLCPADAPALALPGALVLTEWLRWHAPFGGVPLSMLAMTQAEGPLLPIARLAGSLGVSAAVAVTGAALAGLARVESRTRAAIALGAVVLTVLGGLVAPHGHDVRALSVATVQGGGPQQTRSYETDYSVVLGRHLTAAEKISGPVDLVVLPENIVNVHGHFAGSIEQRELVDIAKRLHATVVVGVVEDRNDPLHFWNAVVAIGPDGADLGRYDKVRRVPFGEYVPMRFLLDPIAHDVLPPRDAVPGKVPAILDTPAGKLAVAISWEVFFPRRVREGLHHDAEIVLNPTNGSSYWLTQVQTQQVASSILRAEETGRWVLQSAPTGFSAIVDPDGDVVRRSSLGEARVLQQRLHLRRGNTPATWLGDLPALVLALALLVTAFVRSRSAVDAAQVGVPMAPGT